MPEIPNSNLCPVKSFVSYTSKLNSSNNKLWQKPKDSFCSEDNVWFCNIAVGQRTLSNFMTKMSELCELSIKHTNHSVRATGAILLSRSMFNPAQIMAVTGHKSVSSLAVYQRVSSLEKVAMGQAISRCIDKSLVPVQQNQSSVTTIENDPDDELFRNIDLQNITCKSGVSSRLLPTLFQNCQINNLTINITNKN